MKTHDAQTSTPKTPRPALQMDAFAFGCMLNQSKHAFDEAKAELLKEAEYLIRSAEEARRALLREDDERPIVSYVSCEWSAKLARYQAAAAHLERMRELERALTPASGAPASGAPAEVSNDAPAEVSNDAPAEAAPAR